MNEIAPVGRANALDAASREGAREAAAGCLGISFGISFRSLVLLSPLVLCACSGGILNPRGTIASSERLILLDATAIMLTVVVPVILMTLAFAWWFRASNARARYLPDWEFSGRLELIVWSIPTLIVLFLGGIAWVSSHDLDPMKPIASKVKPLSIEVVSLDWKWLFIYPDQGIASVNELVVPAGAPLDFKLTSATVMNSFFIPQLGSQIYTMYGMVTHLSLQADQPGTYPGLSAQFSGDGFSDMHFSVKAMTADSFEAWVKAAHETGRPLDASSYAALSKSSSGVAPAVYSAFDPALFQRIVNGGESAIEPAPAPVALADHSSHSGN